MLRMLPLRGDKGRNIARPYPRFPWGAKKENILPARQEKDEYSQ